MKWLIIVLLLLTQTAFAGAYRWVNDKGDVVFSDSPPPEQAEFEEVDLPPAPKIQSVAPPKFTPGATKSNTDESSDQRKAEFYKAFSISSPKNDQTLRANDGVVSISVGLPAGLIRGDLLVLLLDGKSVASGSKTSLKLTDVSRGTHKLTAQIKSHNGKVLISDSITFHVQRAVYSPP